MANSLPFQYVGIYGVGLLGGSLGLALKQSFPSIDITGIGRSEERLKAALTKRAIDRYTCDPSRVPFPLDLLVVCTPVRLVSKVFQDTVPSLKPGAVVTDVGSTKASLVKACEQVAGEKFHFVGSHPMAGSHKTGVGAAKADLFKRKICIVTNTPQSHPASVQSICNLWKILGMRIIQMTPAEHDFLTAHSSHLPHLVAAALCEVVQNQGAGIEPVLGDGFRDTTRIALGDPALWVDICLENRDAIVQALSSLSHVLVRIREDIQQEREDAICDFLTYARDWKKRKR